MKLCLIGSSRFQDLYYEYNARLTLRGHIVYSIATVSTGDTLPPRDKELLDLVHLLKIYESEACVVVTDNSGYIGDSTRREITWARLIGRRVFLDPSLVPNPGE